MMIYILLLFLNLQAKEIALTFDDAPRFANGYLNGEKRAKLLIETFRDKNTGPVTFFCVSNNINQQGHERLLSYVKAGHIIANHTHTHPNFNEKNLDAYEQDFLVADEILAEYKTFRKFFRFPYLREGNDRHKSDGMRKILEKEGYHNAYITINNYDWYMEQLFQDSMSNHKGPDLIKFKKFYLDIMMANVNFYDQMAIRHLGRSPRHILLLHEMDITALLLDDLIVELRKNGWKIISLERALKDPIANYQTKNIFKYNPGRIGEIAYDKGQKKNLWHESCDEKYLKSRFNREVLGKFCAGAVCI